MFQFLSEWWLVTVLLALYVSYSIFYWPEISDLVRQNAALRKKIKEIYNIEDPEVFESTMAEFRQDKKYQIDNSGNARRRRMKSIHYIEFLLSVIVILLVGIYLKL